MERILKRQKGKRKAKSKSNDEQQPKATSPKDGLPAILRQNPHPEYMELWNTSPKLFWRQYYIDKKRGSIKTQSRRFLGGPSTQEPAEMLLAKRKKSKSRETMKQLTLTSGPSGFSIGGADNAEEEQQFLAEFDQQIQAVITPVVTPAKDTITTEVIYPKPLAGINSPRAAQAPKKERKKREKKAKKESKKKASMTKASTTKKGKLPAVTCPTESQCDTDNEDTQKSFKVPAAKKPESEFDQLYSEAMQSPASVNAEDIDECLLD